MEYLVGSSKIKITTSEPYDQKVLSFILDLSLELSDKKYENFPEIKTLAFWCRRGNLEILKKKSLDSYLRTGVGLIFHITPSNMPTNFAYSLLFGLLTGNTNIVKVPSKKFIQIDLICKAINKILNKKKFIKIKDLITIIRFDRDEKTFMEKISSLSDIRMIWGGNNSIKEIKKFKVKEKSLDITFADKFSFSILEGNEVSKLSKFEFNRLIENFYNDTLLVDQNACSSPHLILWSKNTTDKIIKNFWTKFCDFSFKKYNPPIISSIDKYSSLCNDCLKLKNYKDYEIYGNNIYIIKLKKLDKSTNDLRGKWGYFYQYKIDKFGDIEKFVDKNCQTLTYYGYSKKFIQHFFKFKKFSGIDRIVPIGQSLDINMHWDGYDLNKILTKIIDIK